MSQLTTHILDTTKGKPADGVEIILYQEAGATWKQLAKGFTDTDGRVHSLLADEVKLSGVYKIRFETKAYFSRNNTNSFYPFIEICFEVNSADHYHIPLLLNPYGYTTYLGS